jgi:uncharacterized phage infection (PIP) family protein YhgE
MSPGACEDRSGRHDAPLHQPFVTHLDGIRHDFNRASEQLQSTLNQVSQNARGIDSGANEIRAAADDLAKRTEQRTVGVEETAAALEEITTTVKDETRRPRGGSTSQPRKAWCRTVCRCVRRAVLAMQQISKSANELSNIIGTIGEIVFQTKRGGEPRSGPRSAVAQPASGPVQAFGRQLCWKPRADTIWLLKRRVSSLPCPRAKPQDFRSLLP